MSIAYTLFLFAIFFIGTHGHMKCVFNGQLKSQDTILMNLYKRIFPKWTYEPLMLIPSGQFEKEREMDVE